MKNNCTLSVYEKAMPSYLNWRERFEYAAAAGFDAVEISIDESEERLFRLDDIKNVSREIYEARQITGVSVMTMCLSGHRRFPLGSRDGAVAAKSVEILRRAVELASECGIRIIQLAGYDVWYEPSGGDTQARFCENLDLCVEIAARRGVILAFETMENDFMNTISKAMVHVKRVGSPYLAVYPDIGNITNSGVNVARDIAAGANRIVAAHVKETRPGVFRDLLFGEGRVDFEAALSALYSAGVRIYNAEIWLREGGDWKRDLSDSRVFIKNTLDKIDKTGQ